MSPGPPGVGAAVSRGPGPQAGALPEVPPALPGSLLPPHPSPNLSQEKKGGKGQRKRFSSPLSENEILKITKRRCSARRGLRGEPGLWGPTRPSSSAGALPAARSLCPRHAQLGPLALPFPLCSGGSGVGGELLRREVAVEMEEVETLGSGPQAAEGPQFLGAPPLTPCSAAARPLRAAAHPRVLSSRPPQGVCKGPSSGPPSLPPCDIPS